MSINLLVTGSNGFIGKNLISFIKSNSPNILIKSFNRQNSLQELKDLIFSADIIIHLAGQNRSNNNHDFILNNIELSKIICEIVIEKFVKENKLTKIIFSSSIQAEGNSQYSITKRKAEEYFLRLIEFYNMPVYILRIMNVFGKWCKPNYNSVVATFCYKIINNQSFDIIEGSKKLHLIYIDDLVKIFFDIIFDIKNEKYKFGKIVDLKPTYIKEVREIANLLHSFHKNRLSCNMDNVGRGFSRALYSTYISYLEPKNFSYKLDVHEDTRGVFVEILKNKDSGQISFFTAKPGITRGGHFHDTKTEKFIVVAGKALFRFRNILTGESFSIKTSSDIPEIVDTIPGWSHDITNIGEDTMITLLWANELFDNKRPDTYRDTNFTNLE